MGYSMNSLRKELSAKQLCDEGLIAWGQNTSGTWALGGIIGGAIGASSTKMHVITMVGDSLIVCPFTNKNLYLNEGLKINKALISSAKVTGLLTGKLTVKLTDGRIVKYQIMQGKSDLKKMLNKLGF